MSAAMRWDAEAQVHHQVDLNWRTITPANHPAFLVKGTELAAALCGAHSRFQIVEVRTRSADGFPDREYCVRDASKITLEEVRAGKRPPIVGTTGDLDQAIAACMKYDPVIVWEE